MENRFTSATALAALLLIGIAGSSRAAGQETDWPAYGGGPEDIRYSPLTQINTSNVSKLRVAWTYDTGEKHGDPQTQPLMMNGMIFGVTPMHKVVALDAARQTALEV